MLLNSTHKQPPLSSHCLHPYFTLLMAFSWISALRLNLIFFLWMFEVFLCRAKVCHQATICFCFFSLFPARYPCSSMSVPILECMTPLITDEKSIRLVDTVTVFFSQLLKQSSYYSSSHHVDLRSIQRTSTHAMLCISSLHGEREEKIFSI